MHRLLVLYPHPADPDAFRAYYKNTHLPLAAQLPGMLDWRYSVEVNGEPESPYFAVFEGDFVDGESLAAALSSPQGRAVQADVANYATGGAIVCDYPCLTDRSEVTSDDVQSKG